MVRIDMHCHSRYSERPSEWFLQRLGTAESYTDPETIYRLAKERGMSFVTITDHNRIDGALLLKENHPDDVITGLEATTYFPEDGCKVHILVYGLDAKDFEEIQKARENIYDLRDCLRERGLAHSVAHATYSVNGKTHQTHLEKLILLFDVFETMNGARNRMSNDLWTRILRGLRPEHIEDLRRKHNIEPFSETPWAKGFTGGSDDHAALFVGRTYTTANARTPEELLAAVRNKETLAGGRHSDYRSFAFAMYKIIYHFSRSRSGTASRSLLASLTEYVFERKDLGLKNRLKINKFKADGRNKRDARVRELFASLVDSLKNTGTSASVEDTDRRLEVVYDKIAEISDEFFRIMIDALAKDVKNGNVFGLVRGISASIPGLFLSLPFFTSLRHMHEGREHAARLLRDLGLLSPGETKRILWFTDTFNDLNGVSVTLRKLGWLSYLKGASIKIVTSLADPSEEHPSIINLPQIFGFNLPHYEHLTVRIPSVLKSMKMVEEFEPDEIFISTPGPIGLLGLLFGRLLNVRVCSIYHTDFGLEASQISGDPAFGNVVDAYMRWFYSLADEVRVPTREYMRILEDRGLDRTKMKLFRRGIDYNHFAPRFNAPQLLRQRHNIPTSAPVLLYVGRISQDKNIDFLLDLLHQVRKTEPETVLLFAGDGPYLPAFREKAAQTPGAVIVGKVSQHDLPLYYSGADLFVFASTTDTFGMVILESQACGLPAVVSDHGGPKEIILPGRTGLVAKADDLQAWTSAVLQLLHTMRTDPQAWERIKSEARRNIKANHDWDTILRELVTDIPHVPHSQEATG